MSLEEGVLCIRNRNDRCCLSLCSVTAVVKLVQVIHFYDSDQGLGISGRCGIAGGLQAACPSPVVSNLQPEQALVTFTLQETGVVLIAFPGTPVFTEFLIRGIIVLQYIWASPVAADFDTEVVVGLCDQTAPAGSALQQALSQRDTGRNAVFLHLLNSNTFVLINVSPVNLVCPLRKDE